MKEPPFFGVRLAKVLELWSLTGNFTQTLGRGRGYVIKLWSEITSVVAVQSGRGHICFTKPFLLKMGCEISGWMFMERRLHNNTIVLDYAP